VTGVTIPHAGYERRYCLAMDEPLSDEQLTELEALTGAAAPGPWVASGPGIGGPEFIRLDGVDERFPPDMYIHHDDKIAAPSNVSKVTMYRSTGFMQAG
jgi:hypothetical protein